MDAESATVSVIDSADASCPFIPLVEGEGYAKAIMWPGNGAKHRTFHLIELAAGSKTVPLSHASESVYYVIGGGGAIRDLKDGQSQPLIEGAMIHIGGGDRYQFVAGGDAAMKLLGGPCPADPSLYDTLEARL